MTLPLLLNVAQLAMLATIAVAAPAPVTASANAVTSYTLQTNNSANAIVYLSPPSTQPKSLYLFAVGTSFSNSDYTTLGQALAAKGVIMVVLDYAPGSTFKGSSAYPPAFGTTLQALQTDAEQSWPSKYNISFKLTPSANFFIGGHSAGGKAVIDFTSVSSQTSSFPLLPAGVVNWDPVDGNTLSTPMAWPMPHLILNPVNSGCSSQISTSNNGVYYYNLAQAVHGGTTLQQYQNTNIHHNSISSSGFLGNLVCSGTVTGLQADLADKIAAFAANPAKYASILTNSTTGGTFSTFYWTK